MKRDPKLLTYVGYKFYRIFNGLIFFTYYEYIWSILCVFVSAVAVILFKTLYRLLADPEYNSILIVSRNDIYIVVSVIVIIWIVKDLFMYSVKDIVAKYIDPINYKTEEDRKNRSLAVCKFLFDFIFYSLTTMVTYYILKDSPFLPPFMLGSGDLTQSHPNSPEYYPVVPYLKELYLFQLGYHSYALLYQIFRKRQDKKFYEFLLHHMMAFFLIFNSYCINLLNSGIMVLLNHDVSDAVVCLCRGYSDTSFKNKKAVNVLYVIGFAIWIYTRLYAFPRCFIIPEFIHLWEIQEKYRDLVSIIMMFLIAMNSMLYIMHIYWSIFMVKAIFLSTVKNKVKVEYDLKDLKDNKMEKGRNK